jgi:NAD(P)-dependent dehydrogenase (short-subunit alcohol dehydrogenase family)
LRVVSASLVLPHSGYQSVFYFIAGAWLVGAIVTRFPFYAGMDGKIVPLTCDIAKEEDLDKMVERTIAEFGKMEILACIAQGGEHPTNLLDATP